MENKKSIAELIADKAAEFARLVERVQPQAEKLDQIIAKLPEVCYLTIDYSGLNISISGVKQDLVTTLRALRREGYKPSRPPEPGASSYAVFCYHEDGTSVWLCFVSTQCQRVQVGTETREVPIYEVQCSEPLTGIMSEAE